MTSLLQMQNIWRYCLFGFLGTGMFSVGADGSSFSYSNFGSPPGLILQGDAAQLRDRVRLTPSVRGKVGGFWCGTKQSVRDGFETTFQFQITEPGGLAADGIAFVIQNSDSPQLGGGGGSVGVGGLSNAVAVKFDNYHWRQGSDGQIQILKYDEVAVLAGDSPGDVLRSPNFPDPQAVTSVTNGVDFSDGRIHTVKITYVPGMLQVFYDDLASPLMTAPVNLDRVMDLDNGQAWIGFTAATGADFENHDLLAWSFVSFAGNGSSPVCYRFPPDSGLLKRGTATINGQTLSLSRDGFGSASNLILNGDVGVLGDRVRLTPSFRSKAGGLWYGAKQFVKEGFEATFQFQITEPTGFGADGLAFVIQNSDTPRLGGKGGSIGFSGITNAVVVKFDNYHYGGSPERHEPRQILKFDEVGVQAGGPGKVVRVTNYHPDVDSLASVTNGVAFSDGRVHEVRISYIPGNIRVFLDNFQSPLVSVDIDLSQMIVLDHGRAWVGFTAATGADSQNHDLLGWSFVPASDGEEDPVVSFPGVPRTGAATINGQRVSFSSNSFGSTPGLIFQGNAGLFHNRARLTPSVRSQVGGLWSGARQPVKDGFETVFQFQITEPTGFGADGLAFVIQDNEAPRLGGKGGHLGVSGVSNAVAVKFDNYHYGRPAGQPVSVHVQYDEVALLAGQSPHDALNAYKPRRGASATNEVTFADRRIHTAKITYAPGNLRVYLDNFRSPLLSLDVDLGQMMDLDHGRAWVGLTAATGADSQNHDVLGWSFVSSRDSSTHGPDSLPTDGLRLASQPGASPIGVSPSTPAMNVVPLVISQSPSAHSQYSGSAPVTSNALSASVLGTWETAIKGADKGSMILTFANDFTLSGYGIRMSLTNLFTVTGDWRQDGQGNLTGHWWEKLGNADTGHGTFAGVVVPGRRIIARADDSIGSTYLWAARPAVDYIDLSGYRAADIIGPNGSSHVEFRLSPYQTNFANYPGVFAISGARSGKLMISSRNRIFGYLESLDGGRRTFNGRVIPTELTLELKGVYETDPEPSVPDSPE